MGPADSSLEKSRFGQTTSTPRVVNDPPIIGQNAAREAPDVEAADDRGYPYPKLPGWTGWSEAGAQKLRTADCRPGEHALG